MSPAFMRSFWVWYVRRARMDILMDTFRELVAYRCRELNSVTLELPCSPVSQYFPHVACSASLSKCSVNIPLWTQCLKASWVTEPRLARLTVSTRQKMSCSRSASLPAVTYGPWCTRDSVPDVQAKALWALIAFRLPYLWVKSSQSEGD